MTTTSNNVMPSSVKEHQSFLSPTSPPPQTLGTSTNQAVHNLSEDIEEGKERALMVEESLQNHGKSGGSVTAYGADGYRIHSTTGKFYIS